MKSTVKQPAGKEAPATSAGASEYRATLEPVGMLTPAEIAELRQDMKTASEACLLAFKKTPLIAPRSEEEQFERLAMKALGMVPGFSPAKRKKLKKRLSPSVTKKAQGRPLKWDKHRYWYLLLHMAGWRDGGNLTDLPALLLKQARAKLAGEWIDPLPLSLKQARAKLAGIYGVKPSEIEERIALARKKVRREDLPDWAQWVMIPGAKPPRE